VHSGGLRSLLRVPVAGEWQGWSGDGQPVYCGGSSGKLQTVGSAWGRGSDGADTFLAQCALRMPRQLCQRVNDHADQPPHQRTVDAYELQVSANGQFDALAHLVFRP